MAGKPKAPKLWWDEKKGRWRLRFTHEGQRYEFSNSSIPRADESAASRWQATTVADVLAGRWGKPAQGSDPHAKLAEVGAAYLLERTGGEITPKTAELRKMHLRAHLVKAFRRLSDITEASLQAYQSQRLKEVRYETIKKELSTLRQVLKFAKLQRWITDLPEFPEKPGKAKGTRHKHGNQGYTRGVSEEHIRALVPLLPEFSRKSRRDGICWPIRGLVEILHESGLRVGFWDEFRVGVHWRPGSRFLEITEEVDKNRWGRQVPLSKRAVELLESLPVQEDGRMFAARDFRHTIRKAAREVMPKELADRFHIHDVRHVRTTALMTTGNPIGVGYLVGHVQVTTTNRYAHQNEAAARDVLEALEARTARADSGAESGAPEAPEGTGVCDPMPSAAVSSCAKERTRTSTGVTPPAPQGGEPNDGGPFVGVSHGPGVARARVNAPRDADSGARPQNLQGFPPSVWALAFAAHSVGVLGREGAA